MQQPGSSSPRRVRPSLSPRFVVRLLGVFWALSVARPTASASGGDKPPPAVTKPALTVSAATAALRSADTHEIDAGIAALGERGGRQAVRALGEFLVEGQPDALADHALAALGATAAPEALPWLAIFARHRRVSARLAAYGAAAHIAGTRANELLASGLRDSDPRVRGVSARSLGERGAKPQLELLIRALERGVPEAAAAIGRIGDASASAHLHAQLGRLPIQVLLSGYEPFLLRAEIDEGAKLDIVARLGEVASPSVKQFLSQLAKSKELAKQTRLLQAITDTAKRIAEHEPPGAPAP